MDAKTHTLSSDLADGFYVVQKADLFFTFRIKTQADSPWYAPMQDVSVGQKIADDFILPSRDWLYVGTIENGIFTRKGTRIMVKGHEDIICEAMLDLCQHPEQAGIIFAQKVGRCCVCNRKLTHPESVLTGIGPECAGKRNRFKPQEALAEYNRLTDLQTEERLEKELAMQEPIDIRVHIPTSYDDPIARLEIFTHRHGYFYWCYYKDDEYGGESCINTIEKIEPTGTFEAEEAGRRMTEIESILNSSHKPDCDTQHALVEEEGQLAYLAHKEGLQFVSKDERWICVPLPGRES